MPNLAQFHPQVVHFVIALGLVGVGLRIVSLAGRWRWMNPAATTLLVLAALASIAAVRTGTDAHGPVERIPGARAVVSEHEEEGETTRNVFILIALVELVAFGASRNEARAKQVRWAHVATAIIGVFAAWQVYETADEGGKLVYSYAGGPGLRTGDPQDVQRLLLSGLYNQSALDRREGRAADAATLVDEMARRFPNDTTVKFLRAESLLRDRKDYRAALAAIDSIGVTDTDMRLRMRQASLRADVYAAMGMKDSARAALAPLVAAFPQNTRLKAKLDSLK